METRKNIEFKKRSKNIAVSSIKADQTNKKITRREKRL